MISLGPVDRFAAGAVGEPGDRTFYLEVAAGGVSHWFVVEKQQVAVLAARSLELIQSISPGQDPAEVATEVATELGDPGEPAFRVGEIGLSYLPDRSAVTYVLRSTEEDDEPVEFEASIDQVVAMAAAGAAAVAAGRPLCPRCNLPMDSDGHICPALNGDLRATRR